MVGAFAINDHSYGQQRMVKAPTVKSADIREVMVRLDVLRDIVVELVAALPSDRAAGFVAALDNRLTRRICDMDIDERTDNAMVSDLAPVFAALRQRPIGAREE